MRQSVSYAFESPSPPMIVEKCINGQVTNVTSSRDSSRAAAAIRGATLPLDGGTQQMISVTKLLGGPSFFGDRLRYDESSSKQQHGTRSGSGPGWCGTRPRPATSSASTATRRP